jgi:hypothetical protein
LQRSRTKIIPVPENKNCFVLFQEKEVVEKHLAGQGCQMVYFQTKIPIWVIFEGIELEMIGIFYCYLEYRYYEHLVYLFYGHWAIYVVAIWYIFPHFGLLCQEKSGNPVVELEKFSSDENNDTR